MSERYVAYVGTYTHENSVGIHVYDVDKDTGKFSERSVAPISNPSYLVVSKDGRFLYSIEDEGVAAFDIKADGDLTKKNQNWIGGMRGAFLDVDSKHRFLFVGGYHDARVKMMRLKDDGSIGDIACGIFHQSAGLGPGERHLDHAKVTCVRLTPDEKFLCAVDFGLNQIKVYRVNYELGRLEMVDIIRPEINGGARDIMFSSDGRFAYVLDMMTNQVESYAYSVDDHDEPVFDKIETVDVLKKKDENSASIAFTMNDDGKYIFVSVDAMNGIVWLKRDSESGKLEFAGQTFTSGDFPKNLAVLPGSEYVAVLNHDTNDLRTLKLDLKGGYALMQNAPISVNKPNCIQIHKLEN